MNEAETPLPLSIEQQKQLEAEVRVALEWFEENIAVMVNVNQKYDDSVDDDDSAR